MALSLEEKKAVVAEVSGMASGALSVVAAEYRGLTADELTQLRVGARQSGVGLRVVKNSLAKRAFGGTEFECMNDDLAGPLIFAFSNEDPGSAARLVRDFAKAHDKLVPKLAAVGGEKLLASDLDRLANLPTRDQALSMLLGVIQAPVEQLVRTMAEPHAKLVRTLAAVRDRQEAA